MTARQLIAGRGEAAQQFGFETGVEGWERTDYAQAFTNHLQPPAQHHAGSYSLRVDMLEAPANLDGRQILMWVYGPAGAYGHPSYRNGFQAFVKDDWWRGQDGAWTVVKVTNAWMSVAVSSERFPNPLSANKSRHLVFPYQARSTSFGRGTRSGPACALRIEME